MKTSRYLPIAIIGNDNSYKETILQALNLAANAFIDTSSKSMIILFIIDVPCIQTSIIKTTNFDIEFFELNVLEDELFKNLYRFKHVIFVLNANLWELINQPFIIHTIQWCQLLNIPQIIFAINRTDHLNLNNQFNSEYFQVKNQITQIIQKTDTFQFQPQIAFFPISLFNPNTIISKKSTNQTLITFINETFTLPNLTEKLKQPLQFTIFSVRDNRISIKIEKGILHENEPILIIPDYFIIKINQIIYLNNQVDEAVCGQWVEAIIDDGFNKLFPGQKGFSALHKSIELQNKLRTILYFYQHQQQDLKEIKKQSISLYFYGEQEISSLLKFQHESNKKNFIYDVKTQGIFREVGERGLIFLNKKIAGVVEIKAVEIDGNINFPMQKKTLFVDLEEINLEERQYLNKCRICMLDEASIILKPCGHLRYCNKCVLLMGFCGLCEQKTQEMFSVQLEFKNKNANFSRCDKCLIRPFRHLILGSNLIYACIQCFNEEKTANKLEINFQI